MANDVKLEKVAAWYNAEDKAIYITCDDPRIVDEHGKRKGVVISVSPVRQAKTYERLARLLESQGLMAPGSEGGLP